MVLEVGLRNLCILVVYKDTVVYSCVLDVFKVNLSSVNICVDLSKFVKQLCPEIRL